MILYDLEQAIGAIEDSLEELDKLLELSMSPEKSIQWKDKTLDTLKLIFGEDSGYVKDFQAIEFHAEGLLLIGTFKEEDEYRFAMEDAKSFLIALMDEIESESRNTPGLMDMEQAFAEMRHYLTEYVKDPLMKDKLSFRITRLRQGMLTGDISTVEVKDHIKWISDLDPGLFERLAPLLTWYYLRSGNPTTVS
ncbi:MAG: hypothetical protein J7J85_08510 [Deltaproteobacteria bacterium]|nr:hypothetical protein [Deltaproteobacteria bacterium]